VLLKFDLSTVPELSGATITSAELQVYAESSFNNGVGGPSSWGGSKIRPSGTKDLYVSPYSWSGDVTWAAYYGSDYAPASTSAGTNGIPAEGWDNNSYSYFAPPVGTYSGGKWAATGTPLATCSNTAISSWDKFTVTSAVQQFVTTPTANKGFIIRTVRVNYEDVLGVNYTSSEGTEANRPKLVITYSKSGVTTYALTVTDGTGDGSYASGTSVTIKAEIPAGKEFVKWSSTDGVVFADANSASTTITMLGKACSVKAEFKDIPVDSSHLYIDQKTIVVTSASSQETEAEDGKSSNMLDGSTATIWHSQYSGTTAKYPHEIVFDLAKTYAVSGIEYTGRTAGANGNVKGYEVYVSNDGVTWGTPVKTGTFTDVATAQNALFSSTEGQYVKFVVISSQNGADFAAASEFSILWDAKYDSVAIFTPKSTLAGSPIQLRGAELQLDQSVSNAVVRVMGFNGRVVAERAITGSSFDLNSLGLSRGVYAVSVVGKEFRSPTMKCTIK